MQAISFVIAGVIDAPDPNEGIKILNPLRRLIDEDGRVFVSEYTVSPFEIDPAAIRAEAEAHAVSMLKPCFDPRMRDWCEGIKATYGAKKEEEDT